jgi:hypothetical protein
VIVRLLVEYRREGHTLSPGALLRCELSEAASLIEDGLAVPYTGDRLEREYRRRAA